MWPREIDPAVGAPRTHEEASVNLLRNQIRENTFMFLSVFGPLLAGLCVLIVRVPTTDHTFDFHLFSSAIVVLLVAAPIGHLVDIGVPGS
jgi:hypothetical protein